MIRSKSCFFSRVPALILFLCFLCHPFCARAGWPWSEDKPNLTVKINRAEVRGQSVFVDYTVSNNGDANTPFMRPVKWRVYFNGEVIGDENTAQLNRGTAKRIQKTYQPLSWREDNKIIVMVDPDHDIDEKDEDKFDNEDSYSVSAPQFTELLIGNVEFEKQDVTEGDTVTVSVEIENKGNVAALNPQAEVIFNDKEKKSLGSFSVPANSSQVVKTTFTVQPPLLNIGRNQIRAWVQPSPRQESIEKPPLADHKAVYLEVKAKPAPEPEKSNPVLDEFIDLAAGDLGIPAVLNLEEEDKVSVHPQVYNYGTVEGDALLSLYLDGRKVWGKSFEVAPGSSGAWSSPVDVKIEGVGSHILKVEAAVYSRHQHLERNNTNNIKEYRITVLPPPAANLKVEVTDYRPLVLTKTENTLSVDFCVTNNGQGKSAATFARILINNQVVKDVTVPALAPGAVRSFNHQERITGTGKCAVKIIVNAQGQDVRQPGVGYNEAGFEVEIEAAKEAFIDLAVGDLNISETSVVDGSNIVLEPEIWNYGTVNAAAKVRINFAGNLVEHYALLDIAPNSSKSKEVTVKAAGTGNQILSVFVEPSFDQESIERNSSNNNKQVGIKVSKGIAPEINDIFINDQRVEDEISFLSDELPGGYVTIAADIDAEESSVNEVFLSRDNGATWEKVGDSADFIHKFKPQLGTKVPITVKACTKLGACAVSRCVWAAVQVYSKRDILEKVIEKLNSAYRAGHLNRIMSCFSEDEFAGYSSLEDGLSGLLESVQIGNFQASLTSVNFLPNFAEGELRWSIDVTQLVTHEDRRAGGQTRVRFKLINGEWKITYLEDLQALIHSDMIPTCSSAAGSSAPAWSGSGSSSTDANNSKVESVSVIENPDCPSRW